MPKTQATSDKKGYQTLEYTDEEAGRVDSLTSAELENVLDKIASETLSEEIREKVESQQTGE